MQKKKFRQVDEVGERTHWIVFLMLVKRKARGPGPILLCSRERWRLGTWTLRPMEKMQGELLTPERTVWVVE